MAKKAATRRGSRKPRNPSGDKAYKARIAATIAELEQLKPTTAKAAKVIALLKSWLADESGYDEKVWPRLKKALNRERDRVGARRLFDAYRP